FVDENLSERITKLEIVPPNVNFECGKRGTVNVTTSASFLAKRSLNSLPSLENSIQFSRVKRDLDNFMNILSFKRMKREAKNKKFQIFRQWGTEPFFVRLGEHNYGLGFGKPKVNTVEDVGVDKVLFHPNFILNQGYHDIALLKLNTSITVKNEISPICLPWQILTFDELLGQKVTVAGWGRLSFGGTQSSVLQEVNVTVFDSSVCEKSYSTLSDYKKIFPQGMSNENVLCAGDVNGIKDACDGDSGGPIMYFSGEDKVYYLAGVISKGFGCGLKDFPGLYSPLRDTETLEWIKNNAF
ncbi:Kallikrein-8, partial [Armadillidium vulgare]